MKRLKIVLFSLLWVMLFLNVQTLRAETEATLVIHYYRYDGNYNNSYVHLWEYRPTQKGGMDMKLSTTTDTYGSVTRIPLSKLNEYSSSNPPTEVGVIIKQGSGWDQKDVPMDRFVKVNSPDANGEIHAYFVQGDSRIGTTPNDPQGPDRSDKVYYSYFKDLKTIIFNATKAVESSQITLKKGNTTLTPTISLNGSTGTLTLSEDVDFSETYTLSIAFEDRTPDYQVTFDGIYDSKEFEEAFTFNGDLGALYEKTKTTFKLWAPISSAVSVVLYDTGAPSQIQQNGDDSGETHAMTKGEKGVWSVTIDGDLHGKYYTFNVTNGTQTHEVIDPYAVSSGVNGLRGMIVDFDRLNPQNWSMTKPATIENYTDAIIYELHVRDLTSHTSWNGPEEYRGKFLGLTVEGTKYEGVTTGLDHLKELGITHLHLLPSFDFGVVDETRLNDPTYMNKKDGLFNWGYMPLNFNVPEGSYATDPYDGTVRVQEFKQMVQSLHTNDIRVVMDVVYNHTGLSGDSNFHLILPGYYHRMNQDGSFSNGSGTGNEMASERSMVRKYMVDSVKLWANEYNVDGFRFDLMALHDVQTMKDIKAALHAIDPTIIIYGEPWMGGTSVMDPSISAGKENIKNMEGVAAFSDVMRDGIKGSVFDASTPGFVQGNLSGKNGVMYGIAGGINHPEVDYDDVWHTDPLRTVNYVSAHDNHTLYDKLILSNKERRDVKAMQKQANAIVLTSQGIPFLHAGVDFLRSKDGDENSYNQPDAINQIDWSLKAQNIEVFNYYKGLIELRKAHPAFRMTTAKDITNNLKFIDAPNSVIAYQMDNFANEDTWEKIIVLTNGGSGFEKVLLPEGEWNVVVDLNTAGVTTLRTVTSGQVIVRANETVVLYQGERELPKDDDKKGKEKEDITPYILGGVAGLGVLGLGLGFYLKKRSVK